MLKLSFNFFFCTSVYQSMNNTAHIKISPSTKPVIVFQEINPCIISIVFSAAYLPRYTITISLINLPTKKGGITTMGLIFAMAIAVNKGVVGMGINVYIKTIKGIFHFSPLSFSPRNLSSASFFSLITFEVSLGIYKVIRYRPIAEPATPTTKTSQIFK